MRVDPEMLTGKQLQRAKKLHSYRPMKYTACIFTTVVFLSCLVTPLPEKTVAVPPEYGTITVRGDLRIRIDRSVKALIADTGRPAAVFRSDSLPGIAYRAGDALLGFTLMADSVGRAKDLAAQLFALIPGAFAGTGYGDATDSLLLDERHLAAYGRLIRGLCEYYRRYGDSEALDLAMQICDSLILPHIDRIRDYPPADVPRINVYFEEVDSLAPGADTTVLKEIPGEAVHTADWILSPRYGDIFGLIEPLAQLNGYLPDAGVAAVLEVLVPIYLDAMDDYPGRGTFPYLSAIRGLLRYGKQEDGNNYLQEAERAWELFTGSSLNDMYGSGRTTPEGYGIVCPDDASQAYIAAFCLWDASGKGDYLQLAENIWYNSIAPSQMPDGRFSCLLSDTIDGRLSRYTGDVYGGTVPWVEALPFAAEHSYYVKDNKVLILLYGDGEIWLEEKGIRLVQTTAYPLDSIIRLEVVQAPKRGIGIQLYFPTYMTAKSLKRDSTERVTGTVNNVGLLEMREVYRQGDVLEFQYYFTPKWVPATGDGSEDGDLYKAAHGPLLLGYHNESMLWLQRGVPITGNGDGSYFLDPGYTYTQDTVSGKTMVSQIAIPDPYHPPVLHPVYVPMERYGSGDILPEYYLFRIGRE